MGNVIFIDVREPEEYATGHLEGALNLPLTELIADSSRFIDIPKDSKLVVYCNSGRRSEIAAKILTNQGYKEVVNGISQDKAPDFA